jgi:hypothetical protein
MTAHTQGDYYVWQVPGKSVSVHIHLDVVDRLVADVMRAFAAIPKRGAEVGGILLGAIEYGPVNLVRIDDFEAIETHYKSGPSYLLSDEDRASFRDACERWQPGQSRALYAVGYYRSHTRDGLSLAPEDIALLDEFFPSPAHLALLIKPYGSKPSLAGFFFREDGAFPSLTAREFPFRRRELSGSEPAPPFAPPRRPETPRPSAPAQPRPGAVRSTVWIPLSLVFLLFGVALGLMIALARGSNASARDAQNFSLGLSVSPSDDNLSLRWDRDAAAIRAAHRGVLEIEDGGYSKSVDLDPAQLQNGNIIYRNSSAEVHFRLTVYPNAHTTVTETMDWKR